MARKRPPLRARIGRACAAVLAAAVLGAPLAMPGTALAGEQLKLRQLTPALTGNVNQGAMAMGAIDDDYYREDLAIVHGNSVGIWLGTGSDIAFHGDIAIPGCNDVALADLDGDNHQDMIVSRPIAERIEAWKGDGAGGFTLWPGGGIVLFPGTTPRDITVGDLNFDSRPDVVFALGGTNMVAVMLTAANGTLGAPAGYAVTGIPTKIAIEQLVGSSHRDIAVLSSADEKVTILQNVLASPGTFSAHSTLATGNDPHDIGMLWRPVGYDIVVTNTADDDIRQFVNNTNGTFTAVDHPTPNAPRELIIADLNMDYEPEAIVACATSGSQSSLHLMRNTGRGTDFVPAGTYTFGNIAPSALAVPEFTREWKTDVVVTTTDGAIQRFRNISVPVVRRIQGNQPNRYSTSVELAEQTHGYAGADTVVIATGENYPDALCGVPLAHAVDAPILLVKKGSVPSEVANEIKKLGATHALLIGGTGAISAGVQQYLKDALGLAVERVGGSDRYETSYLIAKRMLAQKGWSEFYDAYVATGENYPDALAVAGFAAHEEGPILLVKHNAVPGWTKKGLAEFKLDKTVVCGSKTVVSDVVMAAFPSSTRLGGTDRYQTARAIATYALGKGFHSYHFYAATGEDFPDALSVGLLSAEHHYPLILTGSDSLPSATKQAIVTWGPDCQSISVIGGPGAVADSVLEAMRNAY